MKTKNLFFALAIICLPTFAFSETEPNDIPGQASTLGVNSFDAGSLNSTDIIDWWKITIPSDGKLIVNTTSDATLELDLRLYDINGSTCIATYDTSWGIHEATHYNNLMPGTYYVKANAYNGYGAYTISSVFTATGLVNDTENNDSVEVSVTLPLNNSTTGHLGFYSNGYTDVKDWWKITIPADGKLVVNTTSDATLELDLRLYDINGSTCIATYDTSWGIHEATHYNNLMPGTYYVKANAYNGYGSYTISSIFVAAGLTNDIENNDTYSTAATLPLNGSSTGHLGYYTNGYTDNVDWWKVTVLSSGGNLIINTTSNATLDIDLYLYDINGTTQIAGYDTSTGIHEATHFNNIPAGTYYIKAWPYIGYGSYTVSSFHSLQTGITNNNGHTSEVMVFPNPTLGKITVSSFEKINSIEIYNMIGEKVFTINDFIQPASPLGNQEIEINLSDFQKGAYLLKIYNEQKIQTKKIVIQ